jgi:hypothetical protein
MAFKSPLLGKYVSVRAWEYQPGDLCVRYLSISDRPISVARTVKSARKLLDMVPDRLREMIVEVEKNLEQARKDLAHDISVHDSRYLEYHERQVKDLETRLRELAILLNGPIDVVRVESVTTTTETVI